MSRVVEYPYKEKNGKQKKMNGRKQKLEAILFGEYNTKVETSGFLYEMLVYLRV